MNLSIRNLFSKHYDELDLTMQRIIFDQYYSLVYKIAYRFCSDENAAKDIVQETFIRAFKYIDSYESREDSSIEGWLVTIAKNEAIKFIKKMANNQEQVEEEIEKVTISEDFIEKEVITNIMIDSIKDVVNELPGKYKYVFLLRYVNDYSYKEIGDILDINENTARQRASRAKKMIIKCLLESGQYVV